VKGVAKGVMATDRDLIRKVLEADAAAFDELYERHASAVRRRLVRIVRDEAAADDLLQETFLKLWTRAEQWQATGSVAAWLARIATNLALNHLRSKRRRPARPLELPESSGDESELLVPGWMIDNAGLRPDEQAEHAERRAIAARLLGTLPEHQRRVVELAHEAGLDIGEIAEELDIPPGTVKSRLHYARATLAQKWKDLAKENGQ
jgi:RNA polymerase sigma-70 factor (ECF subfamily)